MKKKKQMKIILAMVVVIAILLGGWVMMKSSGLSAEEIQKPQEEVTGENDIPEPPNPNAINVQDNFYFVDKDGLGAKPVTNWTNTVRMFSETPGSMGALWYKETISLAKDFEGDFAIYFGKQEKESYDGVTLTFQNAEDMEVDPTKVIGYKGAGLGVSGSGKRPDYVKAVTPAISVAFNPGIKYNWDSNTLENNKKKPTVSLAIPYQDDITLLYFHDNEPTERGKNPNYNVQYSVAEKPWLNNGKWLKVSFKWNKDDQTFSYRVGKFLDDDDAQTEFQFTDMGEWQTVQFGTGETNGTVVPGDAGQTITKLKETAEEYFGGKNIYWGFTGANIIANYNENGLTSEDFKINPVVSIGKTPNQSQWPLKLSMQKLGEIDPTTGERAPLKDAEFILQAQDADGTWRQFNPEEGTTKDVAEVFTTDKEGKIVIKATDGGKSADIIDLVLQYGGTYNGEPATEEHPSNYAAFRFREVKAAPNPDGDAYIAPPAIDPKDPTNYAASEPANSAALFTTKSVKLSGRSTTIVAPEYDENGVLTNKDDIQDDGYFGTVYNSNQNWLPYYQPNPALEGTIGSRGWLDSVTSYIPKSNAFVMQYLPGKTKVKEISSNLNEEKLGYVGEGTIRLPVDEPNQLSWIKFENVGFYNGEVINAKISVTTEKVLKQNDNNAEAYSFIGIDQAHFMHVEIASSVERADVEIEFFSDSDFSKPVGIESYWTGFITLAKKNSFPLDLPIVNVYSINRDYRENGTLYPIKILYGVIDQDLVLQGTGHPNTDHWIQTETTITFGDKNKKADKISYSIFDPINNTGSIATQYQQQSQVKVEFPDPQVTKTDYTEIIGDGKGVVGSGEDAEIEDFSFQFVQQVPWESAKPKNNRTQFPTWNVKASVTGGTVAPSTEEVQGEPKEKPWTVIALDDPFDPTNQTNPGLDADKLFDFSEQDKITPKGSLVTVEGKPGIDSEVIAGDDFYNHYYSFQKEVSINYDEPILAADLKEREKTPTEIAKPFGYFDFTGSVKLDVVDVDATPEQEAGMNKDRDKVDVSYHTQMNFLADKVKYKYVDKAKYDEILAGNVNPTDADKAAAIEEATIPLSALPDELKDSEKTKTKTGQAIVTWQVPLTPTTYTEENLPTTPGSAATAIDGYEYVSAELNGGTNLQVKVTKLLNDDVTEDDVTEGKVTADDYDKDNEVVLFYSPNELTLTCDDDIHFAELDGENNIPTSVPFKTGANRTIPRAKGSTDWKVYVNGGLPSGITGYSVTANYVVKEVGEGVDKKEIPQLFQNDGNTLPANILEFKDTSDDPAKTIGVGPANATKLFYATTTFPTGKSWGADAGFSLNLSYLDSAMIALRLPKGSPVTYTAEIELSFDVTR